MEKQLQSVFDHLNSDRPSFLFLGQNYLALETGHDLFLSSISSKYASGDKSVESYSSALTKCKFEDESAARTWIADTSLRLVTPKWLEIVSAMAWNGAYTSAIDTQVTRAFRNEWRTVQPIFSKKFAPTDARNPTNLHVTYLFGSIEREDTDERTPLNEIDLIRRSTDAIILLSRLSEQVTPFGMLFIEGYNPNTDWLKARDLATVLLALEPGQAHFFSVQDELRNDPLLSQLAQNGQIVLHAESLAAFLNDGHSAGALSFAIKPSLQRYGHYLSLGDNPIEIPENIWAQTSRSATIIDDGKLQAPKPQSPEKKYSNFRHFLAESATAPVWTAYSSGFALKRDFEDELYSRFQSRLKYKASGNDPIILHGQTGTGKTVSLGSLAYRIRKEGQCAVLFIERHPQGPIASDLDAFCKWADDSGFSATVLIWDGMIYVDQYTTLLKNLIGRGRNIILIGSTYRADQNDENRKSFVLAPPNLNDSEIDHFRTLLSQFEPTLGDRLGSIIQEHDATFLVALYRLLPETRSQVKHGLQRETGAAEIFIKQQAGLLEPEFQGGALASAFQRSGVLRDFKVLSDDSIVLSGQQFSTTEELVGLIMVPGRFGLKVPVELVIRTLGRTGMINFHRIFDSVDIFRWSADDVGNIYIGARHPLEAKLICQVRLGGPKLEIEFAKKLLIEVSESIDRSENTQIQFAADLLRNLGPNGPERKLYAQHYEELATCLAKLRTERGVENPRLMLQEATLLREAVVAMQSTENRFAEKLSLLDRAVETLKMALSIVSTDYRTRRLRAMLLVELASTYGTKVRELMRQGEPTPQILANFSDAKRFAYQARTLQPEDFFSIDVISWSTKDLITLGELDEANRLEVIVDLLSMFESCDQESMSTRDTELFNKRRAEFGTILADEDLKKSALDQLESIGSRAGYYLNALFIAREEPDSATLNPDAVQRISQALEYLQANYSAIKSDGRCMFLLLRYWWMARAKRPLFGGERQLLPFGQDDWKYLLSLIDQLMSLDDVYRTPMNSYLRAVATWNLGYFFDAEQIWKELQRSSDSVTGRRRIAKSYVASEADGAPKKFNGTVEWVTEDNTRGQLFVEGIRQKVDFFPRDFGLTDLRRGQAISNFCIAFNYIGPVADPSHHTKF